MSKFTILLAEKTIQITSIHDYIYDYCKEYHFDAAEEKTDISVEISKDNIEFERRKSEEEDIFEGKEVRKFSDEYLETLAVYRKIAEELIENKTILFHGSVVAVDGKGYLFAAKSGTGKSTHTRLWRDYCGSRARKYLFIIIRTCRKHCSGQ